MLKKITWPLPIEVDNKSVSAPILVLEVVMCRDYWRSSFELVTAADEICDGLQSEPAVSLLTRDQLDKLIAGMKLEGQQISPPVINRFYFKVLRAVHMATDEKE